MFIRICLALSLFASTGFAAELKGKKFDDAMKIDGVDLKLNALGIRRVTKFGIPIKIYVAGFYLPNKITDREAMMKVKPPFVLRMAWLRSIDKNDLADGFKESLESSCAPDCEKAKPGISEFINLISDVRDESVYLIRFTKDGMEADLQGREPKKAVIKNPAFNDTFMKLFWGDHRVDEQLANEMLGKE